MRYIVQIGISLNFSEVAQGASKTCRRPAYFSWSLTGAARRPPGRRRERREKKGGKEEERKREEKSQSRMNHAIATIGFATVWHGRRLIYAEHLLCMMMSEPGGEG